MSEEVKIRREIRGVSKTVRELLSGVKYSIDYYQREYKWTTKQVQELIEDLITRFNQDHDDAYDREAVASYGHYFLGSIVISSKGGQKFVIDGQQRLTTLTLLLIFLHNTQKGRNEQVNIKDLIFSEKYGKRSFNLDIPERAAYMDALFSQKPYDSDSQIESVRNILGRHEDIQSIFPSDVKDETLPYFIDWLIDNVHLVEITAYSDDDAYTIFETMNDRGLSLSPTDMLKGYLLANITNEEKRTMAADIWKKYTAELTELRKDDNKEEVADFFKAWLRSQYAKNIRERKVGAKPEDFDRIGTEFHRWVREGRHTIGLRNSDGFYDFVKNDMSFYADRYIKIREASFLLTSPFEEIFYVAEQRFTLQFPVLLAALKPKDSEEDIRRKIKIVSIYLDILLARRLWNWHSNDYGTMQYAAFVLIRDVRGKSPEALVETLSKRLDEQDERFITNDRFSLTKMNRPQVHRFLARMTDFIEQKSGLPSHYTDYTNWGDVRYEVEHIWADHPDWFEDEFNHPTDFRDYRNHIGGLLLLPKSFNASYGDLLYKKKLKHYDSQNLLARSLHENCYDHNPGFLRFIKESKLPFESHSEFHKADSDKRQVLYTKLAEMIWNPDRLIKALE
jgi:uncharacterized protein with ParB-like and HNH nuclease domain